MFEAETAAGHAKAVEEALNSADRYFLPYENDSDGGEYISQSVEHPVGAETMSRQNGYKSTSSGINRVANRKAIRAPRDSRSVLVSARI
jgi:hypothetical protein